MLYFKNFKNDTTWTEISYDEALHTLLGTYKDNKETRSMLIEKTRYISCAYCDIWVVGDTIEVDVDDVGDIDEYCETHITWFTVPTTWAIDWILDYYENIGEFLSEYTWDDTYYMWDNAITDGVILNCYTEYYYPVSQTQMN